MGGRYTVSLVGPGDWKDGRHVFVDNYYYGPVSDGPSLVIELEGDGHELEIVKRLPQGLDEVAVEQRLLCHVPPKMIHSADIQTLETIDDWGDIEYVFAWSTKSAYTYQGPYPPVAMAFFTKWEEVRYVKFVGGFVRAKPVAISRQEYERIRGRDGPIRVVRSDLVSLYPGDSLATMLGGYHAALKVLGDLVLTDRNEVLFRYRQTFAQRAIIGNQPRFEFHLPLAEVMLVKPAPAGLKREGIVLSAEGTMYTALFMGRHLRQSADAWRSLLQTQQT